MSFKNQKGAISACFILFAALLLLTGCGKNNQKIINNLNARPYDKTEKKEGVCVGIKDLSNKEAKAIFSKTNKSITHKYKVIQLNVENNTTSKYEINKNSFETKIETIKSIYDYMKTKTLMKTILSSTVLSTATLPLSLLISIAAFTVQAITYGEHVATAVLGISLFFIIPLTTFVISNIFFGRRYIRHNKQTLQAINDHVLNIEKENIILPSQKLNKPTPTCPSKLQRSRSLRFINKLIFVDKKNWKNKLNLILFDIDTLRFLKFNI